ncbi:MAG: TetR/AcrR family transcriptional regulator [Deltaproteobacteria bacterium]|nr:TetR/AcrR family transcriptional regulator [Deltaproteobacteria bacterium]
MDTDLRKQMLLEVGKVYFGKHSYDEISIEDLAKEAGISKGLLYHYFPTKRLFYIEIIRAATDHMLKVTDLSADLPPLERLIYGLEAYLVFAEENAATYITLLRSGIGVDPEVTKIVERSRQVITERVLDSLGLPKKPPARVALALRGWIGFSEAVTLGWLEGERLPREDVRKTIAQQLAVTLACAGQSAGVAKALLGRFGKLGAILKELK